MMGYTTRRWAIVDDEGEPVRFFDYEAEGSVKYPPDPPQLPLDHPDWDNPPF